MAGKEKLYQYIKIGGLVSFIPFVLVSGPIIGYTAGTYVKERFGAGDIIVFGATIIGLVFSIYETIRIIKKAINIDKDR